MKVKRFVDTSICILMIALFSTSCISLSYSSPSPAIDSPSQSNTSPPAIVTSSQSPSPSSTTAALVPWTGPNTSSVRYVNEDLTVDPEWRYIRLRSGPDRNNFSEICRIQAKESVDFFGNIIAYGSWWAYVKYQGKEGYVPSNFLNNGNAPMIEWSGSMIPETWSVKENLSLSPDSRYVQMRNGPGTEFLVTLKIPQKDSVRYFGTSSNAKNDEVWAYVQYQGQYGWVYRKLLIKDSIQTPIPTATTPPLQPSSESPIIGWGISNEEIAEAIKLGQSWNSLSDFASGLARYGQIGKGNNMPDSAIELMTPFSSIAVGSYVAKTTYDEYSLSEGKEQAKVTVEKGLAFGIKCFGDNMKIFENNSSVLILEDGTVLKPIEELIGTPKISAGSYSYEATSVFFFDITKVDRRAKVTVVSIRGVLGEQRVTFDLSQYR